MLTSGIGDLTQLVLSLPLCPQPVLCLHMHPGIPTHVPSEAAFPLLGSGLSSVAISSVMPLKRCSLTNPVWQKINFSY